MIDHLGQGIQSLAKQMKNEKKNEKKSYSGDSSWQEKN